MEIFILVMIFILGLCLGSFVNMLVYRTAVKYKIIKIKRADTGVRPYSKSRSHCDFCGKQLHWYENIPVISWVYQKGKSRCCQKKLSTLYPIVETIMGLLFLIYGLRFTIYESNIILWISGLVIITLLVFLTVFDLKYMILPDFAVIILIIVSFLGIIFDEPNIIPYLLSAVGSVGFLGLLHLITKGKGMGLGDVKLAVFMGLFLGYPNIIVAMYLAFVVGALVGLIGIISKKMTKKTQIPFGPFLILGTLVAWFWGNQIINLMM